MNRSVMVPVDSWDGRKWFTGVVVGVNIIGDITVKIPATGVFVYTIGCETHRAGHRDNVVFL